MVTETKRVKAHKILRNKNSDFEINPMDYTASFVRALNHLNYTYDSKQYRSWVVQHYPKTKFGDYNDQEFRTLGALCRLLDNGNTLSDEHIQKMESEFKRLSVPYVKQVEVKAEKDLPKAPSIQDKMDEKVSEFMAEFNGLVDQYAIDRTIPKINSLVVSMGIKGPMLKKVADKVGRTMGELQEAIEGKDKQLVEGYSNFKKVELKKLLGIYEELISSLSQAKVTVVRKTRTPKVKPPAVVAAKVKYKKIDEEFGLQGINPVQVVGSTEVWVFNKKYRKLQVYEAQDGFTLTFKGTTLLNFNIEKSFCKTVRKPEQLGTLNGKRAFSNYMKTIKGKPGKVTGRLNEECLILAVFK